MTLPQETISRIGKEAAEKSNQHSKLTHSQHYAFENGYFEGAITEATHALEREKVLVEENEQLKKEYSTAKDIIKQLQGAFTEQYSELKEKCEQREKVLVDALEEIKNLDHDDYGNHAAYCPECIASKALATYTQEKEGKDA